MTGVFGYFGTASDAHALANRMTNAMRHANVPALSSTIAAAGPNGAIGHIGIGPFHRNAQAALDAGTVSLSLCGRVLLPGSAPA